MLQQVLKSLSKDDYALLFFAFESGQSQIVKYDGDKFIGVNVQPSPIFEIVEESGKWSLGNVRQAKTAT